MIAFIDPKNGNVVFIRIENFQSWPQAAIMPVATTKNAGLMTKEQVADLAAAAAGGIPGDFVPITTFFNDFAPGGAPGAVPGIRKVNGSFQMQGVITGRAAGNPHGDAIMVLPAGFRPIEFIRLVPINIGISQSPSTNDFANPNWLGIDRDVDPVFGVPGAVYIGVQIPASDSGASLLLDGVIFPQG